MQKEGVCVWEPRVRLGPLCIVCCMTMLLCFMRALCMDGHACVWLRKRRTEGDRVRKYVLLCVCVLSYTQKVSEINAVRLSPRFIVVPVFSHAVCQSASSGSTCITELVSVPCSSWFESCFAHWHTSLSLSSIFTHYSDTNHWDPVVCIRLVLPVHNKFYCLV